MAFSKLIKLTYLTLNFTRTNITGVGFDKIVGKLNGKDILGLVLIFGETKIKNDLGVINFAPPLERMTNLEILQLDLYNTKITD